jgi:hypothetical protein
MFSFFVSFFRQVTAFSAFSADLDAARVNQHATWMNRFLLMITVAPAKASPLAVSYPIPMFPPVNTTVFPARVDDILLSEVLSTEFDLSC